MEPSAPELTSCRARCRGPVAHFCNPPMKDGNEHWQQLRECPDAALTQADLHDLPSGRRRAEDPSSCRDRARVRALRGIRSSKAVSGARYCLTFRTATAFVAFQADPERAKGLMARSICSPRGRSWSRLRPTGRLARRNLVDRHARSPFASPKRARRAASGPAVAPIGGGAGTCCARRR
jgi:hypothetical protein